MVGKMMNALPDLPQKGRGAVSNRTGRFEPAERIAVDDGWSEAREAEEPEAPRTTLEVDTTRRIITRNRSPDVPFDRSINPYKGCEHGCIYCFARPTHAYLGLSPGLDFETRLFHKPDAPERLLEELADPKYRLGILALGANTDPYQPVEREQKLTRRILEVLAAHDHPVAIVTKSTLVLRDADILRDMAAKGLVSVSISVTTLDNKLARRMEPRAPTPGKRLATIGSLSTLGVPVSVLASPMIPALNDFELEAILEAAAGEGAGSANYIVLRLPREIAGLFAEWLEAHYPDRARHVLGLMRQMHGGEIYTSNWGERMTGSGEYAELLRQRFQLALRRYGLAQRVHDLDTSRFRRPERAGDQLDLFGA
jgi:DNA repair photolyase